MTDNLDCRSRLVFLPLGGSGEIGMNANLYGCNGKWILCDLGMTFADPSLPGADVVLPDLQFLHQHRQDLLGIVLTHGHEDHIGAIPYLAEALQAPLFATPFTAGLIRHKLEEARLADKIELNVVPLGGRIDLRPFQVRYVALAHSIPEANALLIDTPYGRVFHTGDWKLDERPILGTPASATELRRLGANEGQGTLALIGDSTNVFNEELSGSESRVAAALGEIVGARRHGRIVATTFASNAARLQILGRVAAASGRRVVLAGRAIERVLQTARDCGYLRDFPEPLDWDEANRVAPEKLLIIATGTQGEPRAALARMAQDGHPLRLERGDLVIFSSKLIPGNELKVAQVQNALAARGIDIITDRQAAVHVSGHPGRPALKSLYGWIRPRIAVPVHGERRHLEAHARLAAECGVAQTIAAQNGVAIELAPDGPTAIPADIPVGRLVVDGSAILPSDGDTMAQRRKIGWAGHISVALVLDGAGRLCAEPVIIAAGVAVEGEAQVQFQRDMLAAARDAAHAGKPDHPDQLREAVRIAVRRVATRWTGKKPLTQVAIGGLLEAS